MKKLFTTLVFVGILVSGYSQTQNVKIGPLGFLFGNYNLRYEKVMSDKGTIQVGANYYNYDFLGSAVTGFGIDAGYRHYFKEAMRGAYVYPAVNFDFNKTGIDLGTDDETYSYSVLGVGATIGYQWVTGGNFVIDLGLGYGYNIEVSKDEKLLSDYSDGGVRFQFALGYAF